MTLRPEVIQRLLLAKSILAPYRFAPWNEPSDHDVAMQVLASHDAADMVFAAIADHQGKSTNKGPKRSPSMMEALALIDCGENLTKPTTYVSQLNEARDSLKHRGIFPNTKQWGRVGQNTYERLSEVCRVCINLSLDQIDESALLRDPEVKNHLAAAKKAIDADEYKNALEEIAKALRMLLDSLPYLAIQVGEAKAEDAIKLSGFGVRANDFLRLQEFLPETWSLGDGFRVTWKQSGFGHPGNWREDVARFCLEAFLQIAPRIQDAKWIPGAIELFQLYGYKVTAKEDNVDIWVESRTYDSDLVTKHVVGHLHKGESRMFSSVRQPLVSDWFDEVASESLRIVRLRDNSDFSGLFPASEHFVLFNKVIITCIPTDFMREHFPDLVEIPWSPDEPDRPAE